MSETVTDATPAKPPKRRRGLVFWLMALLLCVLALPVLAYLGLVFYVGMGGLNSKISNAVNGIFNTSTAVGSVSTNWLRNLKIDNVTIEGTDKNKAIAVGSATVDFDYGPLMNEKRIRSVSIDQPSLALRRTESGEWNLKLKPPSGKPSYRIEQLILRGGDLSAEWGVAPNISRIKLQAVSGNIADQGEDFPRAFSFYGVFDSLENISITGTEGPGAAWKAQVSGGLNLERDLSGILGPPTDSSLRGHLSYELTGRQDALLVDTKRGGPIAFKGTLGLDRFKFPLSSSSAIATNGQTFEIQGVAQPKGDAERLAIVDEIRLSSPGLGTLAGGIQVFEKPATTVTFEKINGSLDIATLLKLFQPVPLEGHLAIKGALNVANLSVKLPMTEAAPPSADLSINGAVISTSTLGTLPLCDIKASMAWPALNIHSLKVGDVAAASINLKQLYPDGENKLLALLQGAKVADLRVDIERFWESDIGRRVLTANFDEKKVVAAAADLPYSVKGLLLGANLNVTVTDVAGAPGVKRVDLNGLKVQNASIFRWPFKMNVPMRKVSGDFAFSAEIDNGVTRKVSVAGKLTGAGPKGSPVPSVEFEQDFNPLSLGQDKIGPIRIKRLLLPFDDLDQIVGLKALTGIGSSDTIEITDAVVDINTGDLSGKLALKNAKLDVAVSPGMQSVAVEVMKMTKFSFAAGMIEKLVNGLRLTDVNANLNIEIKNKKLKLSGKNGRVGMAIKLPFDREYTLDQTLPGIDFVFETDLNTPANGRTAKLDLAIDSIHKLAAVFRETIPSPKGDLNGTWNLTAKIDTPAAGGVSAVIEAPIDVGNEMVGASLLTINQLNLAQASAQFGMDKTQSLSGMVKNAKLTLEPFALSQAGKAANGRITAQLEGAGFSSPVIEVAQLTGPVVCVLSSTGGSIGVNTLVKLENYEALINEGALYIPPPEGKSGAVRLVGKYSGGEIATLNVNMLQVDLGEVLQVEAAGIVNLQNSAVTKADFETVKLTVPDMAKAVNIFGPPNLLNRAPWFGDIGLSGAGKFEGRLLWEKTRSALDGKFGFKNSDFTIGRTTPLNLKEVNGELPVMLRQGSWPRESGLELHGKLKLGPLQYSAIHCASQELSFVARPNSLSIDSPLEMLTPAGNAKIGAISLFNLFSATAEPELDFTLSTSINVDQMLKNAGVSIGGMETCILSGPPIAAKLKKTTSARGPWELTTTGNIKAPFFGGDCVVENINARGLLGPAPVLGCNVKLHSNEGIKVTQLTERIAEKYPEFGKFSLRANAELKNFEITSPGVEGIQRFVLDAYSVDFKENDFWYDGRFAMFVNRPLVRAAFPALLFSDNDIKKLTFGVRKLAMQYELRDGYLYGPRPTTLPDNLIIQAYGTEKGVKALFADRLKQDIKGHADYKTAWSEIVRAMKGGDSK